MTSRVKSPPRIPSELHELERAVILLGDAKKRGLENVWVSKREELERLIGAFPKSRKEAGAWKTLLRGLRREVAVEPDPEAVDCEPWREVGPWRRRAGLRRVDVVGHAPGPRAGLPTRLGLDGSRLRASKLFRPKNRQRGRRFFWQCIG